MTKKEVDNKNRKIIEKLFSASDREVLSVIREIREAGNPGVMPALLRLYARTASRPVTLAVVALVRDLKSQAAVSQLFPALEEIEDTEKKKELVAACWQSGLDFSQHLGSFLRIFTAGDYPTALEAFSVIENSLPFLQDAHLLQGHISWLRKKIAAGDDEKKTLSEALLALMEENLMLLEDQS